jgi:competence protein ComGF
LVRGAGAPFSQSESKEISRYEINEEARKNVKDQIHQMVSKHIEAVKMVIDCKRKGWQCPEPIGLNLQSF